MLIEGGIDYNRLCQVFGSKLITNDLLQRFEKLTGHNAPIDPALKRGLFYSHRDFEVILDTFEKKGSDSFYLYTGRGPSSPSLHLGHLIPFRFTAYLQKAFDCCVVIQITDDEKLLHRSLSEEQIEFNMQENIKDIIACGFNPQKTFIFSDMAYIHHMYRNILRIQQLVTNSQVKAIFGVTDSDNIGKTMFPAIQAAPCFSTSFLTVLGTQPRMCLVPCGIDQDPYFRMTRDVTTRLQQQKPALLHSKFLPSLQGFDAKMSGSIESGAIYLEDKDEEVREKIFKYAFSGGRMTKKEHRMLGGETERDVAFQYLKVFLTDDKRLEEIKTKYESGEMMTSELKDICVKILQAILLEHRQRKACVTREVVEQFMKIRILS